jgi:hypothetical protein
LTLNNLFRSSAEPIKKKKGTVSKPFQNNKKKQKSRFVLVLTNLGSFNLRKPTEPIKIKEKERLETVHNNKKKSKVRNEP